jgi:hypothetical protein
LLKWRYQPARRGNSWCLSIEEQRREVVNHLTDNPSLKVWLEDSMASAYGTAILVAARQTGLDRKSFPPVCPWTYQQIMDDAFWPDEEAQGSAP